MKISKYTFLFDVDNTEFYIYSTLSNALIEIDQESYVYLLNAKRTHLEIIPSEIDNTLYSIFVTKKIIT